VLTSEQRRRNRRTGFWLAAMAIAFFVSAFVKYQWL